MHPKRAMLLFHRNSTSIRIRAIRPAPLRGTEFHAPPQVGLLYLNIVGSIIWIDESLCGAYCSMIVSAVQPYFAPFPGFFYKAHLADVLVILDGVQFPLGTTWISRNRFKNSQGTLWMTVPVWKKGLGLQKIDEVRICYDFHWTRKHLESLKVAYAHSPYFADHLPFVEELFSGKFERLIDLNLNIIKYILNQLRIRTRLVLLSDLGVPAKGDLLPVEICRKMGSLHFAAQYSARKYLDRDLFREAGIIGSNISSLHPRFILSSGETSSGTFRHSTSSLIAGRRQKRY